MQIVTTAAAIILSEELGFNVRLESGRTSKQMYEAMSQGEVHAAFEAWPMSNLDTFKKYVLDDPNRAIVHFPYSTLFGRSGIFETCSRTSGDKTFSTCASGMDTEPILSDVLQMHEGERHFKTAKQILSDTYSAMVTSLSDIMTWSCGEALSDISTWHCSQSLSRSRLQHCGDWSNDISMWYSEVFKRSGKQKTESLRDVELWDQEEWKPPLCETANCSLEVLHIAKSGYEAGAGGRGTERCPLSVFMFV